MRINISSLSLRFKQTNTESLLKLMGKYLREKQRTTSRVSVNSVTLDGYNWSHMLVTLSHTSDIHVWLSFYVSDNLFSFTCPSLLLYYLSEVLGPATSVKELKPGDGKNIYPAFSCNETNLQLKKKYIHIYISINQRAAFTMSLIIPGWEVNEGSGEDRNRLYSSGSHTALHRPAPTR